MSKSIYLKGESCGKSVYLLDCCDTTSSQESLLSYIANVQSANPSSVSLIGSGGGSTQQTGTFIDILSDTITVRLASVTEQFTYGGGIFTITAPGQGNNQIVTQLSAIGQSSIQITTDNSNVNNQTQNFIRIGDSNVFITGPTLTVKSTDVVFYDPILTHGYFDIINDPAPTSTLAYGFDFPYIPTSGGSVKTGFVGYIKKNDANTIKNRFVMYNDATVTLTQVGRSSTSVGPINEAELDVIYTSVIKSPDDVSISSKDILIASLNDIDINSINDVNIVCKNYTVTAQNTQVIQSTTSSNTIHSNDDTTISSDAGDIDICGNRNINLYSYTSGGGNINAFIRMIGDVLYEFSNGSIFIRAGSITTPGLSGLTPTSNDLYLGATNRILIDSTNVYLNALAGSPNPLKINSSQQITASPINLNSSEVSNILQIGNGGTSSSSFNINGAVISGSTTTSALTAVTLSSDGNFLIGRSGLSPLSGSLTPVAATLGSLTSNIVVGYSSPNITIATATDVSFNSVSIKGTGAGYAIVDWNSSSGSNVAYNIPNTTTGDFVMTTSQGGGQTISGYKIFSGQVDSTGTINLNNTVNMNGTETIANTASVTVNGTGNFKFAGLTASRPLKLDASNFVTATQINLASTNDVTNTLPIGNGGTNSTSFNINGAVISGTTTTSALTAVTLGTAGNFLISTGASSAPLAGRLNATATNSNITIGYSSPDITIATATDVSFNSVSIKGTSTGYAILDWNSSSAANVAYNIPNTATGDFVMTTSQVGGQTISGQKIFSGQVDSTGTMNLNNITNIDGTATVASTATFTVDGSGNFNFSGLTASRPLKLDASGFVISAKIDLTDSVNDVTGTISVANGGTGSTSFNVNGAVISGTTTTSPLTAVTLGAAGNFLISTSAITAPLAGKLDASAVNSNITIGYSSPDITIATSTDVSFNSISIKGTSTGYAIIDWNSASASDVTYNIPDVATGDFVMTTGIQTISGAKTFSSVITGTSGINITGGTIQLATDATNFAVDIGTSSAAGRTITIGNIVGTTTLNLESGSGGINLGTSGDSNIINIGSVSSASRNINIGTSANANVVTMGSINTTATTTIQSGSGGINLGTSGDSNNINIGAVSSANRNINIGTSTNANVVTIGSTNTAATTTINYGVGDKALNMGPEQIVTYGVTALTDVSGGTTDLLTYTLTSGSVMSGTIHFQIKIVDGSGNVQNGEGHFIFASAFNTGSPVVTTSAIVGTTALTNGTLTFNTTSSSNISGVVTIGITVTSSLTAIITQQVKFTVIAENADSIVLS
jgi:hypothetical protein